MHNWGEREGSLIPAPPCALQCCGGTHLLRQVEPRSGEAYTRCSRFSQLEGKKGNGLFPSLVFLAVEGLTAADAAVSGRGKGGERSSAPATAPRDSCLKVENYPGFLPMRAGAWHAHSCRQPLALLRAASRCQVTAKKSSSVRPGILPRSAPPLSVHREGWETHAQGETPVFPLQ